MTLFLLGIISLPLRFFKPTELIFHSLLKSEGGFCTAQKLNSDVASLVYCSSNYLICIDGGIAVKTRGSIL